MRVSKHYSYFHRSILLSLLPPDNSVRYIDLYALVKTYEKEFSPKPVNPALLNEDGTPLVVYHGTDADFTVFDRTKGRSNMDIQGMFFSPWEIDAQGYGPKVGAYYINLKNPADEGTAFKALNMFQGQNGAGIKARDYLIKQGYDGVNNSGEEFIAFYPEQIKSATDNIGTFDSGNPDIRYSTRAEEVDFEERKVYNRKKSARYIQFEKVGNEVVRHIRGELKKIYSNSDGVADGIAIEHGNDVYIVDSGRENGSITFGIRRKKRIPDAKFRTDFIRENNNDAVSKGYVSDALSQRLGNGMGSDSGRSLRGKSGTEFQIDSRESGDNQRGVSGEDADIGRLKDASRTFADSLTEPTKYQVRDGSTTDYVTSRLALADAFEQIATNQRERNWAERYRERAEELAGYNTRLRELWKDYFTKGHSAAERAEIRTQIRSLTQKIQTADGGGSKEKQGVKNTLFLNLQAAYSSDL